MVELMVSIVILTLIATTTLFSLTSTRYKEELNTAARMLSADIRNIQARALAARNISQCTNSSGNKTVCGPDLWFITSTSTNVCVDACVPMPPPRFGMVVHRTSNYQLIADLNDDYRWSIVEGGGTELFLQRSLNPAGSTNRVTVSVVDTPGVVMSPEGEAIITVNRQSGVTRINACGDAGLPLCAPTEPKLLNITLKHLKTNETKTIEVNAVTGRVSIQ